MKYSFFSGFLSSSAGKESACNAEDSGSVSGLGRSTGEGIGYPLQYSWASLVVQLVKNPLAIWETWVQSLGWADPLEKGKATHSSILAWRIAKSWTQLSDFHFHFHFQGISEVPSPLNILGSHYSLAQSPSCMIWPCCPL